MNLILLLRWLPLVSINPNISFIIDNLSDGGRTYCRPVSFQPERLGLLRPLLEIYMPSPCSGRPAVERWGEIYKSYGSCLPFTEYEYFRTAVALYKMLDPQRVQLNRNTTYGREYLFYLLRAPPVCNGSHFYGVAYGTLRGDCPPKVLVT